MTFHLWAELFINQVTLKHPTSTFEVSFFLFFLTLSLPLPVPRPTLEEDKQTVVSEARQLTQLLRSS